MPRDACVMSKSIGTADQKRYCRIFKDFERMAIETKRVGIKLLERGSGGIHDHSFQSSIEESSGEEKMQIIFSLLVIHSSLLFGCKEGAAGTLFASSIS